MASAIQRSNMRIIKTMPWHRSHEEILLMLVQKNLRRPCPIAARVIQRLSVAV
jgi:hypothetical protein